MGSPVGDETLSDKLSKESVTVVDFDDITRRLGQFGKYQRRMFFLICLVGFPVAFNTMGIVFIAGVPNHWCKTPKINHLNLTDDVIWNTTLPLEEKDGQSSYSECERYSYAKDYEDWTLNDVTMSMGKTRTNQTTEDCPDGWDYDHGTYETTIVTQWDLVCEDKWLQATASSVYMAGLMAGVLIIGSISDILGRRPAFIVAMIGSIIFSISISFAPNYIAFCSLRFLTAFFTISLATTGFVMGMELIGPDYRLHAGLIIEYFWTGGYMLYALIAYFIRDWFTLNLVASCSMLVVLVVLFFVPESPRWLYLRGKTKQADAIVRKAAKVNKKELPANMDVLVKEVKKGYVWDLCRTPRMARRSINIYFNWFVNSCVYYGLSLNTSNLGGNDYLNFAISGGVEVPALMMCQLALHYGGRRLPLCTTMVIGGVALLCTLAVPTELNWVAITLAMIGKFCISASFAIIYVFTAEMYPTTVRNVGVGAGSFFARIGGIVAPYIGQLSDVSRIIPLVVFGVLSIVAGLLALAFPETKGKALPETLEDGENFGRKTPKTQKDDVNAENPGYDDDKINIGHVNGNVNPGYVDDPISTRL